MEPDITSTPAHTDTKPPLTGWRAVAKHFRDWAEGWFWLPVSLLAIVGAAKFAFFLTGHRPSGNVDWILDLAGRLVVAVLLIFLLSVRKEQQSFWMTKEEAMANPKTYIIQTASNCFYAGLFAWILTH